MSRLADTPDFAQPAAQTALERAVQALEEDIVLGRLHPRERLIEDDLMQRFDLKRHAVRELLVELARLGLAERRKNIGSEVRSFAPREVIELYDMRELLETQAARLVPCPASPEALHALIEIQHEHDAAVDAEDPRQVFRSNLRFHQALFGLCGNGVLVRAIHEYARQTHPIRFGTLVTSEYRRQARHEHWAMIEALREGRREDLVALCRAHLRPSRDAYLAANRHLADPPAA
ncbi:GntR family transcriptional regulator [Achromobacter aloeverae]|uniref:GntR family transcriptional regulator n=1 Tax=Achromobacter aloeverae TaxID=1750518 RepID=A0A4Q1HHG3_9BURK|nr:GntR family transcriptional regulator [Achromobacter aloeverae]RXN86916.1 GntR family transcriptional regulator [Achromobacter aloeverae]